MATTTEVPFAKNLDLFKFDLSRNKTATKKFNALYTEHKGDWKTLCTTLTVDNGFKPEVVKKLQFTQDLSVWSAENTALVRLFQKDETTNSLRDIALNFSQADLTQTIIAAKAHPADVVVETYASDLHKTLFHLEPTATLLRMVGDDKETPISDPILRGGIDAFLSNQPETFNIKTVSVYEAFKQADAFKDIALELHEDVRPY